MMIVSFTVYKDPKGKQRARTVITSKGHSHSYTPKETVMFERAIQAAYRLALQGTFDEGVPLKLNAIYYMPIPQSLSRKKQDSLIGAWHTKKPDTSNITKSVEDALNGLAYPDDSQIAWLNVKKVYGRTPRLEIEFTELDGKGDEYDDTDTEDA